MDAQVEKDLQEQKAGRDGAQLWGSQEQLTGFRVPEDMEGFMENQWLPKRPMGHALENE